MTGRAISPLIAATLCLKLRGQMTVRQVANVDALKGASAESAGMRRLAMRFRGLLRVDRTDNLVGFMRPSAVVTRSDIGAATLEAAKPSGR